MVRKLKVQRDDVVQLYPELKQFTHKPFFPVLIDIVHFVLYKTFFHPDRKISTDVNITNLSLELNKNRKSVAKYLTLLEDAGVFFAVETFNVKVGTSGFQKKTQIIRQKHKSEGDVVDVIAPAFIKTEREDIVNKRNSTNQSVEVVQKNEDTAPPPENNSIEGSNDLRVKDLVIPHILSFYKKESEDDIYKDDDALKEFVRIIGTFEEDPNYRGRWLPNSKYLILHNNYKNFSIGGTNVPNIKT
jgi:hypothetical protein